MAENKMEKLQILEQNLQNVILQKQNFQTTQLEIENALEETQKSKARFAQSKQNRKSWKIDPR